MRFTAREFMSAENSCIAGELVLTNFVKALHLKRASPVCCCCLMTQHLLFGSAMTGSAGRGVRQRRAWSRNTVRPSFSVSWNQSRQVTRLPVQLRPARGSFGPSETPRAQKAAKVQSNLCCMFPKHGR